MDAEQKNLLDHWNIEVEHTDGLCDKIMIINGQYVYKRVRRKDHGRRMLDLTKAMANQGLPVPRVVETKTGGHWVESDDSYHFLMTLQPGTHLASENVLHKPEETGLIAKALADLHRALDHLPQTVNLPNYSIYSELNGWIGTALKDFGQETFAFSIFDQLAEKLEAAFPSLPHQAIHRDFHLKNVLFQDKQVSGYIDFDLSQRTARVYDLAYFSVGLLAEYFSDLDLRNQWPVFHERFVRDYHRHNPLQEEEKAVMGLFMVAIEILFVAYYSRTGKAKEAKEIDQIVEWLWQRVVQA